MIHISHCVWLSRVLTVRNLNDIFIYFFFDFKMSGKRKFAIIIRSVKVVLHFNVQQFTLVIGDEDQIY